MSYTIHGTAIDYERGSGVWFVDSEHNIFPTQKLCAEYHGVSQQTLYKDKGFKSKTLGKLVAASPINTIKDSNIFNGNNNKELEQSLKIYDELFNKYMLKGIPASIYPETGDIIVWSKEIINGNTIWLPPNILL